MSFSVRRRARELGIHLALGAEHGQILAGAVRGGATLVALGGAIGTVLSFGMGRLLSSLLFGVAPGDPVTTASAAGLIIVVGLLACYLPARLVLGVDPAVTLREE